MPDMVDRPGVVQDSPNVPHNHSNFPLKQVRLSTELFGLVKPHMVIDDISTDDIEYRPSYKTRSYTLKAPLMQDVHRRLSYVKVDLPAILPENFEKFYTNPSRGDDVPNDVGTVVENGIYLISNAVSKQFDVILSSSTGINGANNFTPIQVSRFLKVLVFGELFYSRGSLLSSLGCSLSRQFFASFSGIYKRYSYDELFDTACTKLLAFFDSHSIDVIEVTLGSKVRYVQVSNTLNSAYGNLMSFRDFLSEIRTEGDWIINQFGSVVGGITVADDFNFSPLIGFSVAEDVPFNFGRLCAYQLAVAEYMTNDHVDNIYSAELFRQYIGALIRTFYTDFTLSGFPASFNVNGISYNYDWLSGHYLQIYLTELARGLPYTLGNAGINSYFLSLFGFKRSLRYKDYFVSSRVSPLAVGDVSVSVDNNAVSVIDISRNIQVQRFLNAINHSGRRLSNYIKTLFGKDVQPDRHVPHWLADIDELVYTAEVENTGEAQQTNPNSVTAVFSGNSSNQQLHFYSDLPGYIIGLTSYDIERAYVDTIDRSFFIESRFDMFLPQLQFVGDQPVYVHELNSFDTRSFGTAFGYQYRDMQYKLFYSTADGGFVDNLPGYAFLYRPNVMGADNISPDFIRSRPAELDDFYLSLTGYSLGSYFHFISIVTNYFSANRPMVANPKILE